MYDKNIIYYYHYWKSNIIIHVQEMHSWNAPSETMPE